ncbi:hypothetical protein Naga_101727g2 [Nannochloropsis gaditana]|uniref:Uncharacterized protein n=1 Tax=Nannochloropsis gaditana TaxID=72520 RepID=W7TDG2_9STRA|nr:hypothetical protein Naga_101727g2 [Nannochloropsis gaditana]
MTSTNKKYLCGCLNGVGNASACGCLEGGPPNTLLVGSWLSDGPSSDSDWGFRTNGTKPEVYPKQAVRGLEHVWLSTIDSRTARHTTRTALSKRLRFGDIE